eukprot:m51a1_g7321 hypothetical protein (306) ;mRNA; r:148819-149901
MLEPYLAPVVKCLFLVPVAVLSLALSLLNILSRALFIRGRKNAVRDPKCIVITGAGSGFGRLLALHYARPGVTLNLLDLSQAVDSVARECEALGATVSTAVVDVADYEAMRGVLTRVDDERPVDVVFANAGTTARALRGDNLKLIDVNLKGVLATVDPLQPRMVARGRGQIVLTSSIATYTPYGAVYSATKAAVSTYGRTLRIVLADKGVGVTVAQPGFSHTPLFQHIRGVDWLLVKPEDVAYSITEAVRNDDAFAIPPPYGAALYWSLVAFPPELFHFLLDITWFRRIAKPITEFVGMAPDGSL